MEENMKKSKEVYTCMYCKKLFDELPVLPICDICGMPINVKKVKHIYDDKTKYGIIIKISDEKVLNSMRNGEFWFQSPKYYQNFKENDTIGDVNECAFEYVLDVPINKISEYFGLRPGTVINYDGKEYIFEKILNGMIYVSSRYQNNYRLLCFYILNIDENYKIVKPDEKIKLFGTHFSIIKNRNRFIQILGEYAESSEYDLFFLPTPIAYIADSYRGVYTPGCKFDRYAYQNEYRFVLCSSEYAKLPEKEKKIIKLNKVMEENIFSEPIPIDLLWKAPTIEELSKISNSEE